MRELRLDDSSNVRRLKWTEDNKLEVEFTSGAIYVYANVQKHQFESAAGSDSVGSFVQKTFVKNPTAYPFTKVRTTKDAADEAAADKLNDQLTASLQATYATMREALEAICDVAGDTAHTAREMRSLARKALGR